MKLNDQIHQYCRLRHYSRKTEKSYKYWIWNYIAYCNQNEQKKKWKHPLEFTNRHVVEYLTHLAIDRKVSASSQNQALNALVFLYKKILKFDLGRLKGIVWAKRYKGAPTVLTHEDALAIIFKLSGKYRVMAQMMYGSGLRLNEVLGLRVKDIDIKAGTITIHKTKNRKSRVVMLPETVKPYLQRQLLRLRILYDDDMEAGFSGATNCRNAYSFAWQYLWPQKNYIKNMRHHVHESMVQKAMRASVRQAGITKSVGCHTLRHSFATRLLEDGVDIRTIQELLGHARLSTTMIYTHVSAERIRAVKSPVDITGLKLIKEAV